MSREIVERLRTGLDAFNRTGELNVEFLDPDFELHQASSIAAFGETYRVEIEELIDAGRP